MPIIYEQDGNLAIVNVAPGFWPEDVAAEVVPDGLAYEIVDDDDPRLIPEPVPEPEASPVEKLAAFLAANPDVAALIGGE